MCRPVPQPQASCHIERCVDRASVNDRTRLNQMKFSNDQIELACQLKTSGLPWQPSVGHYAFDRERKIKPGSPFQDRIYFFLDLACFIDYFAGIERLHESMVWLPTLEQATELIRELGGDTSSLFTLDSLNSASELDVAYRRLLKLRSEQTKI